MKETHISCHPKTPTLLRLLELWKKSPYFRGILEKWVDINPQTFIPILKKDSLVSFIPMEAVNDLDGSYELREKILAEVLTGYTRFREEDMICAKITPCMQNGKAAVVRGLIHGVGFGSTEFHVLRPKNTDVLPYFLLWALTARSYLDAAPASFTGTAGQQRLPESFLKNLPLPIPPLSIQRKMVMEMELAKEVRQNKLEQADNLLSGLDDLLLKCLSITIPDTDNRLTYAIKRSSIYGSKQIGADYFHPERTNALMAIQKAKMIKRAARLDDIADFIREFSTEYEPADYLGLAGVQSQTGELIATSEEPGKGQASLFKKNDVLFARLRPYLNKVWCAEYDGVCSTEFHVIRVKKTMPDILPDYLAAVLRSSTVVAQTKHMMTGNTHPRLANEDVVDLLIPLPDKNIQSEIVDELQRRRMDARQLRNEAEREWKAAKTRFETRLLGEEAEK